jgi:hypothetical protein
MLVPARFLVRFAYPCKYMPNIPKDDDDDLFDLPATCRLDHFPDFDGAKQFADVRLAWNELGLAVQLNVTGKEQAAQGNHERPRQSDGLTLWIDTRGERTGHRATRTCHQLHFLAAGGGSERADAVFVQTKINRASEEAPLHEGGAIALVCQPHRHGYRLAAFVPATVLNGYDPEQQPRLGVFYAVYDHELGEQTLGVSADFPFSDDPSLWATLELKSRG